MKLFTPQILATAILALVLFAPARAAETLYSPALDEADGQSLPEWLRVGGYGDSTFVLD